MGGLRALPTGGRDDCLTLRSSGGSHYAAGASVALGQPRPITSFIRLLADAVIGCIVSTHSNRPRGNRRNERNHAWSDRCRSRRIGLAASYFFYRIAKKERRPVYVVAGNVVVRGDEKRQIEVRHREQVVPVVTRTVIAFWNAGREPIRRDDLLENHPLRVRLPDDAVLLEAGVLTRTRSEIDFACFPDDWYAAVNLGFSYLNRGDGGVVEILHTGELPFNAKIEGAIVGVDSPPKRIQTPLWDDPVGYRWPFVIAGPAFALGVLGLVWLPEGLSMALSSLGLGVLALWTGLDRWNKDKRRIPQPLRDALGPPKT